MIKKYIYIKCKVKRKGSLLIKLYKNNISVFDVIYKDEEVYFKIEESDYAKLKKFYGYKFYYYSDSGIFKLKREFPFWYLFCLFLFLFWIHFLSSFIVEVQVIHSNKDIRELVRMNLEEKGVKRLTFKKSFETLEKIKKEVRNSYKNQIEWLEIEQVGMKYIVRIEERIIHPIESDNRFCHIVASKSGVVDDIVATKGEVLVHDGQYVNEGDILITGQIAVENDIKNNVCAMGQVLAEVWYTTKVRLPVSYKQENLTGKERFNLRVKGETFNYKIFKSRIADFVEEERAMFTLFGWTFYKVVEKEVSVVDKAHTLEEGVEKAIELADEKVSVKLNDSEYIKLRKVLKKSINDSTIDVELFYAIVENISKVEEYTVEEKIEEGSLE